MENEYTNIELGERFAKLLERMNAGDSRKTGETKINLTIDLDGEMDVLSQPGREQMKNPDAVLLIAFNDIPSGCQTGVLLHGSFNSVTLAKAMVDLFATGQIKGGVEVLKMALLEHELTSSLTASNFMSGLTGLLKHLAEEMPDDDED